MRERRVGVVRVPLVVAVGGAATGRRQVHHVVPVLGQRPLLFVSVLVASQRLRSRELPPAEVAGEGFRLGWREGVALIRSPTVRGVEEVELELRTRVFSAVGEPQI